MVVASARHTSCRLLRLKLHPGRQEASRKRGRCRRLHAAGQLSFFPLSLRRRICLPAPRDPETFRSTTAPKFVCIRCHRPRPRAPFSCVHMQCCAVCCSAAHEACPSRRCSSGPSRLFSRKTEAPALEKGGRPGHHDGTRRPQVHQWLHANQGGH